jgi:hypothetical protein
LSNDGRHWHEIRRSRLFVAVPTVMTSLLAANLIWGVIRQNVTSSLRAEWPLRLIILDVAPTASLLGVFGALILARAQLARTTSPHFGYSWTLDEPRWNFHFFNGGPGHAKITAVRYSVAFHGGDPEGDGPEWLGVGDLLPLLRRHTVDLEDFDVPWVGQAPLVPQSRTQDGFLLLSATPEGLAAISRFEVEISAVDAVGDRHTLRLRATARLPRQAADGVEAIRAVKPPPVSP